MRVAVPICRGRVSPLLDEAQRLVVFEVDGGAVTSRTERALSGDRLKELSVCDVQLLICGAVSRSLEVGLEARGIEVIAEVCGPVNDVVAAYLAGGLETESFSGPGRRARRGRRRGQAGH